VNAYFLAALSLVTVSHPWHNAIYASEGDRLREVRWRTHARSKYRVMRVVDGSNATRQVYFAAVVKRIW